MFYPRPPARQKSTYPSLLLSLVPNYTRKLSKKAPSAQGGNVESHHLHTALTYAQDIVLQMLKLQLMSGYQSTCWNDLTPEGGGGGLAR